MGVVPGFPGFILIIDRLVHHALIFYINGSSYRVKDKLKRVN